MTVSGAGLLQHPDVVDAARSGGARIVLATGALLGLDAVRAAGSRESGAASGPSGPQRLLRRDLPELQADGGADPPRETPLRVRGERNQNGIKERQLELFADRMSTATLFANQLRLYFATFASSGGVSETRLRPCRGRQGPGRAKFLMVAVRISVSRVPPSFSSTCAWKEPFA